MNGPGKYNKQLHEALIACQAQMGILLVFDGNEGPSCCVRLNKAFQEIIPKVLRIMADEIEKDKLDCR